MRFEQIQPVAALQPYVKYLAISESPEGCAYKVFPGTGMVIGFQYSGRMAAVDGATVTDLATAGITGMTDRYKIFTNIANTDTVLVYFTEAGFAFFSSCPANDLFGLSVSLSDIFDKRKVADTEEQLSRAGDGRQRAAIVQRFLLSQLKDIKTDMLVMEAVRLIYKSNGTVRIEELCSQLYTSQSPLEKRFRKTVGATPKKFSSIVRFNSMLKGLESGKSLTDICYENNFFDQAHFIKDFKRYTGDTPAQFGK